MQDPRSRSSQQAALGCVCGRADDVMTLNMLYSRRLVVIAGVGLESVQQLVRMGPKSF